MRRRKICVFLKPALRAKWVGKPVEWIVCRQCQARLTAKNFDKDMQSWLTETSK